MNICLLFVKYFLYSYMILYAVYQSYKTLSVCKKYLGYIISKDNNDYFVFCLIDLKHYKSYTIYEKDNVTMLITEYFMYILKDLQ